MKRFAKGILILLIPVVLAAGIIIFYQKVLIDTPVWLYKDSMLSNSLNFSSDGHLLAYGDQEGVMRCFSVPGFHSTFVKRDFNIVDTTNLHFSTDGSSFYCNQFDSKFHKHVLEQYDSKTGKLQESYSTNHDANYKFSSSGKYILFTEAKDAENTRTIDLWNTASKRVERRFNENSYIAGYAVSPDDRYVLTSCQDKLIHIWDIQTGELKKTIPVQSNYLYSNIGIGVSFSSDGKYLLVSPQDSVVTKKGFSTIHVYVYAVSGLNFTFRYDFYGQILAFSKDGDYIAYIVMGSRNDSQPFFISENSLLGVLTRSGGLHIMSLASGKDIRQINIGKGALDSVAFSPDNRYVATGGTEALRVWKFISK